METSTVMRNIAIVQEVLSGKDYATCANKFNISVPSVSNSIRSILALLKEYTGIDILESSNFSYVLEKKEEIQRALSEPFPKITITPSAKTFLRNKFGKDYARDPGKVAAEWGEVNKAFNYFTVRRDLLSIQKWLCSEGFLVGNMLSDAMLDFAWGALKEGLSTIHSDQGQYSFSVKKVEPTGWKTRLVFQVEIKENEHVVNRRFTIDLIPD